MPYEDFRNDYEAAFRREYQAEFPPANRRDPYRELVERARHDGQAAAVLQSYRSCHNDRERIDLLLVAICNLLTFNQAYQKAELTRKQNETGPAIMLTGAGERHSDRARSAQLLRRAEGPPGDIGKPGAVEDHRDQD